ncbi:MAG TPA: low molecular weight protein-tyrosine-phosphatase [Candidatus Competibacteraceae bacterium]|nr:low molecular weight protein-tyrosine-phosphatase [Candidatus Competibacteraceae bacterium]
MIKVLMVCMGNICRSPTAEGVLRRKLLQDGLHQRVLVDSAGTHSYHIGSPPDRRSQEAALRRGIDLSGLRARQVAAEDLERFDYILAMDQDNLAHLLTLSRSVQQREKIRLLLEFAPEVGEQEVPDPYYGGVVGFERVLDLIEQASVGLIRHLRRQHGL